MIGELHRPALERNASVEQRGCPHPLKAPSEDVVDVATGEEREPRIARDRRAQVEIAAEDQWILTREGKRLLTQPRQLGFGEGHAGAGMKVRDAGAVSETCELCDASLRAGLQTQRAVLDDRSAHEDRVGAAAV